MPQPTNLRRGKFRKGYNAGTGQCEICHKTKQKGELDQNGNGSCDECWNEAGLENEHQDGYHNVDQNGPNAECPMCPAPEKENATMTTKPKVSQQPARRDAEVAADHQAVQGQPTKAPGKPRRDLAALVTAKRTAEAEVQADSLKTRMSVGNGQVLKAMHISPRLRIKAVKNAWSDFEKQDLREHCLQFGPYQGCKQWAKENPTRTAQAAMSQWAKMKGEQV